jgi:hypothetical protein
LELRGLGKRSARDLSFQSFSKSPLLSQFASTCPEGELFRFGTTTFG